MDVLRDVVEGMTASAPIWRAAGVGGLSTTIYPGASNRESRCSIAWPVAKVVG